MAVKKPVYNNDSISMLKGADRVRLRPAVIFGSDGIEGCEHAVFEILVQLHRRGPVKDTAEQDHRGTRYA